MYDIRKSTKIARILWRHLNGCPTFNTACYLYKLWRTQSTEEPRKTIKRTEGTRKNSFPAVENENHFQRF